LLLLLLSSLHLLRMSLLGLCLALLLFGLCLLRLLLLEYL
jgi:hypothetical protein